MELENLKESLKKHAVRHSAHALNTLDGDGRGEGSQGDGPGGLGPGGDRPWRAGMAAGSESKLAAMRKGSLHGGPQSVGHHQGSDPDGLSYNADLASQQNSNGPRHKLLHGSKSSKIRIKGKGEHPDASSQGLDTPQDGKGNKVDYLAARRLNRQAEEEAAGGPGAIKKRNNERTLDQLMNDKTLNDYEKMDAVKRKAEQLE